MARYIVQNDGKITVSYQAGDDIVSFRIDGDNGVKFTPGDVVTIENARLDTVAQHLIRSFGIEDITRMPDDYQETT